ncbi:hypothetical protein GCM10009539_35840 [Cryptosporangium japonicum]|uniref:Uncharacterized protein n=1 Tax=Cryptosporangium japonicum TaxID=80872 RepID=A0ABP3DZZ3_9ACTN
MCARAAGLRLVDDEHLPRRSTHVEGLGDQRERADVGMAQFGGVLRLAVHGVRRPERGERVAFAPERTHHLTQPGVLRVEAGRVAQAGHYRLGETVPAGEERRGGRVEEGHPREVADVLERGEQRLGQRVERDHVLRRVQHERRHARVRVEQVPHGAADRLPRHPPGLQGRTGEAVQVLARRVVHPESPAERVEDLRGRTPLAALLQPGVVVAVHAGEHGDLFAT